jgi:hypothetical protein
VRQAELRDPMIGHAVDAPAVEDDLALSRRQHAGDRPEHRRLAGAVRPEEGDDGSLGDDQRDVLERDEAPVARLNSA